MKKIISILSLTAIFFYYSNLTLALNSVVVSAVVWNLNHSPVVINIVPSNNPKLLKTNSLQNFSLYFRDDEKDIIYYTITPKDWYTNPINWIIYSSDYDSTSWAYINFAYLAPSIKAWNSNVNIILNDWPNIVSKDINLYIY